MTNLTEEVLRIIEEYNERDEEIYLRALVPLVKRAKSSATLQRLMRDLVKDGVIFEINGGTRGNRKCFYISEKYEGEAALRDLMVKIDKNLRKIMEFVELFEDFCSNIQQRKG